MLWLCHVRDMYANKKSINRQADLLTIPGRWTWFSGETDFYRGSFTLHIAISFVWTFKWETSHKGFVGVGGWVSERRVLHHVIFPHAAIKRYTLTAGVVPTHAHAHTHVHGTQTRTQECFPTYTYVTCTNRHRIQTRQHILVWPRTFEHRHTHTQAHARTHTHAHTQKHACTFAASQSHTGTRQLK